MLKDLVVTWANMLKGHEIFKIIAFQVDEQH